MLELTQTTLNKIKRALLRQQREVDADLRGVESDDPLKSPALAETSEPGIESWLAENHAKAVALGLGLKNMAGDVKKALLKIKRGTYGKCEKCRQFIGTARLLAMPTATFCLNCHTKKSSQN